MILNDRQMSWLYPTTAASLKFIGSFQFQGPILSDLATNDPWSHIDLCFNFGSATLQLYDLGEVTILSEPLFNILG